MQGGAVIFISDVHFLLEQQAAQVDSTGTT
jgi:hypothetical protein